MATAVDDIQTAINNAAAILASITTNPQPTYSVNGVSVSLSEYKDSLTKNIADWQELLVLLNGPYQLCTVGTS